MGFAQPLSCITSAYAGGIMQPTKHSIWTRLACTVSRDQSLEAPVQAKPQQTEMADTRLPRRAHVVHMEQRLISRSTHIHHHCAKSCLSVWAAKEWEHTLNAGTRMRVSTLRRQHPNNLHYSMGL